MTAILLGILAVSSLSPSQFVISRSPVQVGSPAPIISTTYETVWGLTPAALWGDASGAASSDAPDQDQVLAAVLAYFSAEEVAHLPRIILATVKPDRVAANAEGFTVPGYPAVYLATWSAAYKAAQGGDRLATMKLAGVLAHEATHVANGPSEAPAYAAEVAMLRRIGAPSSLVDGVFKAAAAAARAGRP